ncbi:MAG: polyprenyl synthetase family protein [Burkholderiales bacterium]
MREQQARIEAVLDRVLEAPGNLPSTLHQAMRYAVLGGGKRVRPLLAYAAGEAVQAAPQALDHVGAAVELIHAYSLVHDDLPCMDDDDLRRGKPTCHVRFGEATALLVGDSLQSLAFATLAATQGLDANQKLQMVGILAQASGSTGMAGGQAIDLESTGTALSLSQLETMHRMKTGALIGAAVRMSALCGASLDGLSDSSPARSSLGKFASLSGLLFQIVDDLLDAEQDSATLGKTAGKDAQQGKATFVTLLGLEDARRRAREVEAEALASLSVLGTKADRLRQLCRYIASRTH